MPEAEDLENVREILFEAYRIQYRIEPTRVLVMAVIHGSRDLARMPRAPWEVD